MDMAQEPKLVLPGDQVAVVEEYEPGNGTYEAGGKVFAGWVGVLEMDLENRVVRVRPLNPLAEVHEGDLVYMSVGDIRPAMASGPVLAIHGVDREVAGEVEGSLHISKISERYTEDIRDQMRPGDVVRGRVYQAAPSVQVSTADPNLGVVRAMCSNCRAAMTRHSDTEVKCPRCERVERRKLAADYADLNLNGHIAVGPEPERPPREFEERDRDRGGRGRDQDRGRGYGGGRDRDRGGGRGRDRGGRGRGRGGGRDRGHYR